jgi:hypothetical protein
LRISRGSTRKPEFFTSSGARKAGAVTVMVCWKFSTGQRDVHDAVQPGAHVHRIAGERQARERQDLQAIGARGALRVEW